MKWIVLDFGTKTIKALRVALDGQKLFVEDFATFESKPEYFTGLSFPDTKAWAAATIALNELDWIKPEEEITIISSLPSAYLESRYLKFPFKAEKKIEKILSFELEALIPFDIEEIQVRPLYLEGDGVAISKKEALVLALAYKRDPIKNYEAELRKFELSIPPVTAQILALSSLRQAITDIPVFGILEFGHTKTQFLAMQRSGTILGLRTFWWGGKSLADAIAGELQIESTKAERIIADMGENRAQFKSLDQSIENFIIDLRQTLKGFQNAGIKLPNPFPIYTLGLPAATPGLLNEIREGVKAETDVLFLRFPSEKLAGRHIQGLENLAEVERALPALSVALAQLRNHRDKIPVFSETGFQFQQNLKKIKTGSFSILRKVALLLIAPFIYGAVQLYIQSKEDKTLLTALNQTLKSSGFQFNAQDSTDDILNKMKKELAASRMKMEQLEEDKHSPLSVLTQLSKAIPPSLSIDVRDMRVTAGRITLSAETPSAETANQISTALKEKFPKAKMGALAACTSKKSCTQFTIEIEREKF